MSEDMSYYTTKFINTILFYPSSKNNLPDKIRGVIHFRKAVSRVLSWMVIYLDLPSPAGSIDLPGSRRAASSPCLVFLRMGFTCARPVTGTAVVSYTAISPLPDKSGGIFLLHFPSRFRDRTLSGILPYEARTFLSNCRDHPPSVCQSILL